MSTIMSIFISFGILVHWWNASMTSCVGSGCLDMRMSDTNCPAFEFTTIQKNCPPLSQMFTQCTIYPNFPWSSMHIVTGPWTGSLGGASVPSYWQVRVFGSSGIVDRPCDHLYVITIPLYRYMDRRYCYIQFSHQAWLACHRKTWALAASPE